eukprot:8744227-Lingulodinium_polyedra.AAC.1
MTWAEDEEPLQTDSGDGQIQMDLIAPPPGARQTKPMPHPARHGPESKTTRLQPCSSHAHWQEA